MNLFKALSYKEWIKTRKVTGVLILVFFAVVAYTFIEVTHAIRLDNANNIWYGFLFMDNNLPQITYQIPLLAGISLALVQFVPEMTSKRLKLTLHLPADETAIISSMLLYGYLILIALFLATLIAYTIGFSILFPVEITKILLSRLLPAVISGLVSYGLTAWICFEPQWKQRIFNLVIAIGLLSVFFLTDTAGVYLHFGVGFILLLLLSSVLPFYSVLRFKHGVL